MRINKVIHRKEACLGAMDAVVSYQVPGGARESIVYDDLDMLEKDWKIHGDGLLASKAKPQIARVEIKVSYQDGRGQKIDTYRDLEFFKKVWQSKNKFFEWKPKHER